MDGEANAFGKDIAARGSEGARPIRVTVKIRVTLSPVFAGARCPSCSSPNIRRSERRYYELYQSIFILPWRCLDCDLRFFRWRWVKQSAEDIPSPARTDRQPPQAVLDPDCSRS